MISFETVNRINKTIRFKSIAQLLKLSQKTEVHLLLISDELKKEDRKQAAAEKKFLLGAISSPSLNAYEVFPTRCTGENIPMTLPC